MMGYLVVAVCTAGAALLAYAAARVAGLFSQSINQTLSLAGR